MIPLYTLIKNVFISPASHDARVQRDKPTKKRYQTAALGIAQPTTNGLNVKRSDVVM